MLRAAEEESPGVYPKQRARRSIRYRYQLCTGMRRPLPVVASCPTTRLPPTDTEIMSWIGADVRLYMSMLIVRKLQPERRGRQTDRQTEKRVYYIVAAVMPWFHVQLLHATRCNSCMQ